MRRWEPYIDAGPVRAHLLLLRQTGMGIDRIVRQSGISRSTVQRLLAARPAPDHRRIRPEVATRLMAVSAEPRSSDLLVDAAATQQRFAELTQAGYGLRDIARRIGRDPASLSRSVRRASTVTARTALAIERVHRELLADKPGHDRC
jgi:lambda repressor-like predicted transcriptional regulator